MASEIHSEAIFFAQVKSDDHSNRPIFQALYSTRKTNRPWICSELSHIHHPVFNYYPLIPAKNIIIIYITHAVILEIKAH
jgi:hypothetical protein